MIARTSRQAFSSAMRMACAASFLCASLALAGCASGGGTSSALPAVPTVDQQMRFGVTMAQRGLWREALFRFQQAELLGGEKADVLGNVAVALEATGDFDRALTYYKRALAVDPANRDLKRNYARFIEFYQSFRPAAAKAALVASPPAGAPTVPAGSPGAPAPAGADPAAAVAAPEPPPPPAAGSAGSGSGALAP